MITRRRYSRVRISFTTRKLGFLGAMLVATTAYMATPTPAIAMPIAYVIDPGAIFAPGPPPIGLSGTFTFDAATDTESDVLMTLGGNSQSIPPGQYTQIAPFNTGDPTVVLAFMGFVGIGLNFSHPLDVSPDTMIGVGGSELGTASFVPAATPEPTSLALLGGALGLFLLTRRANRRDCQA
jgi:PEP-CTERM motif